MFVRVKQLAKEKFAVYGFQLEILPDWRVEMNPKTTREKGDVVFHSQKGNRFFVSWGALDEATKRFHSLEEHRDKSVNQIKRGPDVNSIEVSDQREEIICGHKALITHVSATIKSGFVSKNVAQRDIWSIHLYCPNTSRYYVIYSMQRDSEEYPNFSGVFHSFTKTFVCHPKLEDAF